MFSSISEIKTVNLWSIIYGHHDLEMFYLVFANISKLISFVCYIHSCFFLKYIS